MRDDRTLEITVVTSSIEALHHVSVDERQEEIVVTAYVGRAAWVPEVPPGQVMAVAASALMPKATVELSRPLAGRVIADGARTF